jgi:hypothetical protein
MDESSRTYCEGLPSLKVATLHLIQNAAREVLLMTPDLEPTRLDDEDIALALSVFARSSRHTRCYILITGDQPMKSISHAMIRTQRRLSSIIEIRQLEPEHATHERLMLVDHRHRLSVDLQGQQWIGWMGIHDIPRAKQDSERFLSLWQHAQPIRELRLLSL